jgi:transposase
MAHKSKVSGAERIAAIEKYLGGETTLSHLAAVHNVTFSAVKK